MRQVALPLTGTYEAWRAAAKTLAFARIDPNEIFWTTEGDEPSLFEPVQHTPGKRPLTVPKSFLPLAKAVVCHSSPERFGLLYAALVRIQDTPRLLADPSDPLIARLREMDKNVHRCAHKMKAFMRFRDIGMTPEGRRQFAAWFEPTHYTLEYTSPFFARRFGDMDWRIVTPYQTAVFEDGTLSFEAGRDKPELDEDDAEELWKTYFTNIFNPARLKVNAMTSEMPKKYWKNMPEAELIPEMIATAQARASKMQEADPTDPNPLASRLKTRKPKSRD